MARLRYLSKIIKVSLNQYANADDELIEQAWTGLEILDMPGRKWREPTFTRIEKTFYGLVFIGLKRRHDCFRRVRTVFRLKKSEVRPKNGRRVDEDTEKMPPKRRLWIEVSVDLRWHPKLVSSAKSLELPKVHLEGHLVSLWSGALEYAEDGDLWRGDDASSLRFFESLAEIPADPERFLDVLRLDRWIDGWLIHDWLDHAAKYLIARYSSHNRVRLGEIYAKHKRVYGRDSDNSGNTSQGKLWGSGREADVDSSDPPYTLNPKPPTLNPLAPEETYKENPKGGVGGKALEIAAENESRASFSFGPVGSRVQGCAYSQAELTGDALTHKMVFEAFMPILVMHGILTLESFFARVKRANVTPAAWMMLYVDKIHAVYRERAGSTMLDTEDADPVGMTMAGLIPREGRRRHHPTEAARLLFIEIMMDFQKNNETGRSKWAGRISGPAIALELGRRKGKAGKIA